MKITGKHVRNNVNKKRNINQNREKKAYIIKKINTKQQENMLYESISYL